MSGKIVGIFILASAALIGGGIYWAYNFWYYEEVAVDDAVIEMTTFVSSAPEPILAEDIQAIDAFSSPIRFRACFTTPMSLAMATETYVPFDDPEPLNAPPWFDCFDAVEIGQAIADGRALAFTGERNIEFGIDRVVAIFDDGRGYVWQQINDCGDKLYDGSPAGEDCPERN